MTPWTPVPPGTRQKQSPSPRPGARQPCLPGGVTAPAPRSAGTFKKNNRRPRVPALVNRACRGAVTAPAPRSAGRPPKTYALPAPGGDPLDPRSAGHTAKTIAVPASRHSSTVLAGGRDGSRAPFRRDVQEKQSPSPRPGARQPSLRGRNPPFRGRLTHGHACFLIIQPLFMDKIPQPWAFVPSAAFF